MKQNRIISSYNGLTDAGFANKAESINSSMTGNVNFPAPTPSITVLNTAVQDYTAALTAAQSRDKNDVAVKNQKRSDLASLLVQLASSVMATANGDKAMLVSTGFDQAKDGESIILPKPENIQVTDGVNAGELQVSVTNVKGAKSYVHQYTADPVTADSDWEQINSTTSKYTFKNLDSAKRYWCRVAAIGSYDQVVISDAMSRIVQ